MKDRILKIRKTLKLTQTEFGEKIGLSRAAIAFYERGSAKPTGSAIVSICKVYNINKNWLETGVGSMFLPQQEDDEIISEFLSSGTKESKIAAAMFREILRTPDGWNKLANAVKRISAVLDELDDND